MTKVKVISKYLTLKQLLPSKMGKISLIQLSDEEINTDEVAQKNDLKAISNCHYHKFMFELSKKQSNVRFIVYNRCIVMITKTRSWNNAINQLAAKISWEHSCIIQWGLPQNMHFLLHRFSLSQGFDQGGLWPERPDDGLLHKHRLDSD